MPQLSIITGPALQVGTIVLLRNRKVVWQGLLGSPIEDAVFDTIMMNPHDLLQLHAHVEAWLVTPRIAGKP